MVYSTLIICCLSFWVPILAHSVRGQSAAESLVQRSLYFLDNDPSGASVVSLKIANDGMISNPVRVSSSGVGSLAKWVIPSPPDNTGFAGPDSLYSANSVVVSGKFLFVVNAGSNTLAMFTINPRNPQDLTLVGKPCSTLGDFPVSVAYSEKLRTGKSTAQNNMSSNKTLSMQSLTSQL